MNKITKNALQFLILSFLIVFILTLIFFLLYESRRIDEEYLQVKSLKNALLFREALLKSLKLLPTLVIFIYVLCFSALFTLKPFQTDAFTYSSVAHPSYVLLVLFLILILASELLIIPRLSKEKAEIKYRLRVARRAASYANELFERRNYEKVLSVLDVYLQIDNTNQKMIDLYNSAIKNIEEIAAVRALAPKATTYKEKAPETYYEKGQAAYEDEDYYSALFYFERALELHRDNEELKELYRRTRAQVARSLGSITKEEEQKKRLIQQKERGIEYLKGKKYYEAYAVFSSLQKKYPQMSDLSLYLETVVKELEKIDFLPAELRESEWLPSINNLIFVDRQGYVNTVERIVPFRNNYYFYNIKRIKMSRGSPMVNWKYGKWINGGIRLKNNEGFRKVNEKDLEGYITTPFVEPGYLIYTGEKNALQGMLNVYERFSLSENLRMSGFDIESKERYAAQKLGILFSVYVLTLFLSAFSWAKRSIYEFPPAFKLFLFIIVVPFLAHFLHILYVDMNSLIIYSHRYFSRVLFGGMNLAVYAGIINGIFAIFATLYYLSQSSRVE